MIGFELWRDKTTGVVFYFSHSDENLTTGVMEIPANTELPKHSRPLAYENLVQISGKCVMEVFNDDDTSQELTLAVGDTLRMKKGQSHIHKNPFDQISSTLFKAEGDISEVMKVLRTNFEQLEPAKKDFTNGD